MSSILELLLIEGPC